MKIRLNPNPRTNRVLRHFLLWYAITLAVTIGTVVIIHIEYAFLYWLTKQ